MDAAQIAAITTGIVTIIAAVFAGLISLRNSHKLDAVHTAVDGTLTDAKVRVTQLQTKMVDEGVAIPPSPLPTNAVDPA